MDVWQWVLLYAAFLALVQLLIYYYLRRGRDRQSMTVSGAGDRGRTNGAVPNSSGLREMPGSPDDGDAGAETDPRSDADETTLVCPHCGARNDREPTFTYCRNCVSQLGA